MKKILYLQYTNPAAYPPLQHSSGILADAGWEVLFLGIRSYDVETLSFPPRPGITVRQLWPCRPGWKLKLHYGWFVCWVLAWTIFWRPRWVYASDVYATPIAWILSFLPGICVIYHEHDAPDWERQTSEQTRFIAEMILSARRSLVPRAPPCQRR